MVLLISLKQLSVSSNGSIPLQPHAGRLSRFTTYSFSILKRIDTPATNLPTGGCGDGVGFQYPQTDRYPCNRPPRLAVREDDISSFRNTALVWLLSASFFGTTTSHSIAYRCHFRKPLAAQNARRFSERFFTIIPHSFTVFRHNLQKRGQPLSSFPSIS